MAQPEARRAYQADVYSALATVIQGITLAALGNQLVLVLNAFEWPGSLWAAATGLQSLVICITFWYAFASAYFTSFRASSFTAADHFVLASTYFVIGLLQFMAIHVLHQPRLWLTLVALVLAAALFVAWYTGSRVDLAPRPAPGRARLDPIAAILGGTLLASLLFLLAWYSLPALDTAFFGALSLAVFALGLAALNAAAIRDFQQRLDAG